ncbi:MAG: hypothetical protein SH847_08520 [Roseiflexaceae bacterium]|nr:hypothetical protein [Roseiflexaceae bacterium]
MTPEQQQQWMAQWRVAAVELERIKREELARMTDAEALRAANDLLMLAKDAYKDPRFRRYSGLVEQQRLFMKARKP